MDQFELVKRLQEIKMILGHKCSAVLVFWLILFTGSESVRVFERILISWTMPSACQLLSNTNDSVILLA